MDELCQAYLRAKWARMAVMFSKAKRDKLDQEIKTLKGQIKEAWKVEFPSFPEVHTIRLNHDSGEVHLLCYAAPGYFKGDHNV